MGFFDHVFADAKKDKEEEKYITILNNFKDQGINEDSIKARISFYKDEFNYGVLEEYYLEIKNDQSELVTSEIENLKEVANIIGDGKASPDLFEKYSNFKKNLSEANKTLYSMKILIDLSNVNIKEVQRKALISKFKSNKFIKKHKISVSKIANIQHQLFEKKQGIDKAQQFLIDYLPEETKSMEEYSLLNFVARGTKNISKENNDIDFLKEQRENIQKINEFKTEIEKIFKIDLEVGEKIIKKDIPKIKEYLEEKIATTESETQTKISSEILKLLKKVDVSGEPKESQDQHPSPSLINRLKDRPIPTQEDPKNRLKQENIPLLEFAYIVLGLKKSDYEFTPEDNEKIKNGKDYFISLRKLFNTRQIQEIIDASKNPESKIKALEQPSAKGSPNIIQSNSGDLMASLKYASENSVNAAGASSPKKPYPGSLEEKMNDTMNDQSADAKKTKKIDKKKGRSRKM